MNGIYHSKQKGFTIVELLVVIVVIAVLASITVVAFNGVTMRARNASRLGVVNQAEKAVKLALVVNTASTIQTSMSYSNNWYRACIGIGHPNLDGDAGNVPDCGRYQNDPPYVSQSVNLDNILRAAGALPNMKNYPRVTSGSGDVVTGPFLEDMTVDGVKKLVLEYNLEGEKEKCGPGPLVYGQEPTRTTTKPGTDFQFSSTGEGVTECRIVVADV